MNPSFMWDPAFSSSTVFVIIGLLIIIPAIMLYNELSQLPTKKPVTITTVMSRSKRTRHLSTLDHYSIVGPMRLNVAPIPSTSQKARPQRKSAPAMYM